MWCILFTSSNFYFGPLILTLQEKKDGKSYHHMWYKINLSVGVRQNFGKKRQPFSFGRKSGKSQDELMDLGEQCVKKLADGMGEADVKEWVDGVCAPV